MVNKKLSKTGWGVIILTLLLPFSFALNPAVNIDLSVIRVIIPFLFIIWVLNSLMKKKLLIDLRARAWLLLFVFLISTLSIIWSLNQTKSLRKILFLGSIIPIYWVYYSCLKSKRFFYLFLKTIFWSAFASAIMGILQFLLQFIIGLDSLLKTQSVLTPFILGKNFSQIVLEYNSWLVNIQGVTLFRAIGLFPDPHLFSLFLNISLTTALFLYFKTKKNFYLGGGALILTASLLTFSRAGYLSLFVAGLFIWLRFITKKNIWNILFALLVILFLTVPNPVNKRLYSIFNFQEGSISERLTLWKTGFEITKNNPWGGVGIGNLSQTIDPSSSLRSPIYAHNLFLDFSSEIGFFGGLAIFLMLISPIFSYFVAPSSKNLFLATVFLIIITHSMFETPFYSVSILPLILGFLAI